MSGRFALYASKEQLVEKFQLNQGFHLAPRYNVAPLTTIPVIKGMPCELSFMRWGFIPHWLKSDLDKFSGHLHARIETVEEKPSFKEAYLKRRCLIPVSGYYEWKLIQGRKQPFFVFVKEEPVLAIAAIWEAHLDAQHELVETVAMLTTPACEIVRRVHERMPLIIEPCRFHHWLSAKAGVSELAECLQSESLPYQVQAVSFNVNDPKNDSRACLQSLS